MRKALVTLAIGDRYVEMFDELCHSNWLKYCQKYGYELIVIKEALDGSKRATQRSVAWQKLLILSQEWSLTYDQIIWVDADIIINNDTALDIGLEIPPEKIGGVEAYSVPTREIYEIGLKRAYLNWELQGVPFIDNIKPGLYYENRGLAACGDLDMVFQTGVFVCSPTHHRELFEHVYWSYEDSHGAKYNYEMPAFSCEIVKNDLQYWVSPLFNLTVGEMINAFYPFIFETKSSTSLSRRILQTVKNRFGRSEALAEQKLLALKNLYEIGYFIHFAGCSNFMRPLGLYVKKNEVA